MSWYVFHIVSASKGVSTGKRCGMVDKMNVARPLPQQPESPRTLDFMWHDGHRELQARIRSFVRREVLPHVDEYDRQGTFPLELVPKMGREGFIGIDLPVR